MVYTAYMCWESDRTWPRSSVRVGFMQEGNTPKAKTHKGKAINTATKGRPSTPRQREGHQHRDKGKAINTATEGRPSTPRQKRRTRTDVRARAHAYAQTHTQTAIPVHTCRVAVLRSSPRTRSKSASQGSECAPVQANAPSALPRPIRPQCGRWRQPSPQLPLLPLPPTASPSAPRKHPSPSPAATAPEARPVRAPAPAMTACMSRTPSCTFVHSPSRPLLMPAWSTGRTSSECCNKMPKLLGSLSLLKRGRRKLGVADAYM